MAYYEKLAQRNGVPLPIECLRMTQPQPHRDTRFHYHDYTELLFGLRGRARALCGGRSFILSPGDLVIIHNHDPHDVLGIDPGCQYIVVKFLPRILLSAEQTYSEYTYALLLMENMEEKQIYFSAGELAATDMADRFHHLMEEWDAQQFGYELSLRADVTAIFLYILRKWRERNMTLMENIRKGERQLLIQRALSYIAEHYDDLSEESTAAACGVSASYLSRAFKSGMHESFTAYVTSVRLREARRLLLTGEENVTEIAAQLGFSSSAYFIDRFRRSYGITPLAYRKQYRGTPQ